MGWNELVADENQGWSPRIASSQPTQLPTLPRWRTANGAGCGPQLVSGGVGWGCFFAPPVLPDYITTFRLGDPCYLVLTSLQCLRPAAAQAIGTGNDPQEGLNNPSWVCAAPQAEAWPPGLSFSFRALSQPRSSQSNWEEQVL